MERKHGVIQKEEPKLIWQDKDIAVLCKGSGWIVAISRELEQNKILQALLRNAGIRDVRDLINSGKYEHLCHYVSLKFKEDKEFVLSNSNEHEFGLAHRLDVDTSGALMLGKSVHGFQHLRQAFTSHQVFKEYICLVHGPVKKLKDEVNLPILWDEQNNISSISDQGVWAKSIYTVMGRYRLKGGKHVFTLCRVVIITGRTHQIRIHMASIGHPLVGDNKYNRRHAQTDSMWCPRLFLHAWRIGFWDCASNWHEVKAPLTRDLTRSLRTLEEVQLDLDNEGNPSCRIVPPPGPAKESPPAPAKDCSPVAASAPAPAAGKEPPAPPKPPPPPPKAPPAARPSAGDASRAEAAQDQGEASPLGPTDRERVTLPNGRTLEVPDYLPPPVPAEAPDLSPLPHPPPPPPKAGAPPGQAPAAAGPSAPEPLPLPGAGRESESPRREERGGAWTDVGPRRPPQPAADQAQLEDQCCNLVRKALLGMPKYQSSLGHLGSMRDVTSVLQQMGSKRPKLTKLLRDRPDTFVFLPAMNSEQIVALSHKAMAHGRLEQASHAEKQAAEAAAAGAAQRAAAAAAAAERADADEARRRSDVPPPAVPVRRTAMAPWSIEHQSYEEPCAMLMEMGFERQSALRALRANHGDAMEAMDQLSNMPSMYGLAKGEEQREQREHKALGPWAAPEGPQKGVQDPVKPWAAQDPIKPWGAAQQDPVKPWGAAQEGPQKGAQAAETEEEEMLRQALALSQQEEDERKRRQELAEEEELARALATSLQLGRPERKAAAPQLDEEDLQFREALEQSRRLEDDRRRQERLEEEEVEHAMRESMRDYELFHASGNDALEETLRNSLCEPQLEDAPASLEKQVCWEALDLSYDEDCTASETFEEKAPSLPPPSPSSAASASEGPPRKERVNFWRRAQASAPEQWQSRGSPATANGEAHGRATGAASSSSSSSSAHPAPSRPQQTAASEADALVGAAAPPPWPCPVAAWPCPAVAEEPPKAGFSLQEWFFRRMGELEVGFEKEVLWMALNEIEEEQLGDAEVLKMWLGFPAEEKLPQNISLLVSEFEEQRRLRRFCDD